MDFPITDVLQMMGRAGRPQYDQHGVAVIMVADTKKSFYKKARCLYAANADSSGLHADSRQAPRALLCGSCSQA